MTTLGAGLDGLVDGSICRFKSGLKLSIAKSLRDGLQLVICAGTDKYEFRGDVRTITDGVDTQDFHQAQWRVNGGRWQDVGFAVGYGSEDWTDTWMALREFEANKFDMTLKFSTHAEGMESGDCVTELQPKVRCRAGYTRIFIEYCGDVIKAHGDLHDRFLHYSGKQKDMFIEKKKEDVGSCYLKGVWVGTLRDRSIYSYNRDDIAIDECRNADHWDIKRGAGRSIREAPFDTLAHIMREVNNDFELFEARIDGDYLSGWYDYGLDKEETKARWEEAWKLAFGDALVCDDYDTVKSLSHKGRKGLIMPKMWMGAFRKIKVGFLAEQHLTPMEKQRINPTTPTLAMTRAFDKVWSAVESIGQTMNTDRPKLKGFAADQNDGNMILGMCKDGTVYLREGHEGQELIQTTLEEVAHHVTGAEDASRVMQEWLCRVGAALITKG